jgi:hypothetical protein
MPTRTGKSIILGPLPKDLAPGKLFIPRLAGVRHLSFHRRRIAWKVWLL